MESRERERESLNTATYLSFFDGEKGAIISIWCSRTERHKQEDKSEPQLAAHIHSKGTPLTLVSQGHLVVQQHLRKHACKSNQHQHQNSRYQHTIRM